MSDSPIDRAIKKSSEDASGFEPMRRSPDRLKSGNKYDICRTDVLGRFPGLDDYTACVVIDYITFDKTMWDHNLVNFYFTHEEDPTTTIQAFRWYQNGNIERC